MVRRVQFAGGCGWHPALTPGMWLTKLMKMRRLDAGHVEGCSLGRAKEGEGRQREGKGQRERDPLGACTERATIKPCGSWRENKGET